ncbi:flavin monoamine oxidase family protein [Humitalea sp. 24SJ18S-53]|uniref:flavin monoamine oxidase family protein n=1 Tax=Humitalea sp. 24SJ18S-53 TaxID=3422307 RepID=UPI003D6670B7
MSRTPIFAMLQRAFAVADTAAPPGGPPLDEVAAGLHLPRRVVLGALLASVPGLAMARVGRTDARIVVVGAGLAGLVAAYRLTQAGAARVTVLDANTRVGGRMFSARGVLAPDHVAELGGSFINSEHTDMLALAREFSLTLEDGATEDLQGTVFIDGQHRGLAEIAAAAAPMLPRLQALRALPEEQKPAIDRRSAAEWLDEFGTTGWLRKLLDVGLTQEMGLEPDRLSGLYLVEAFAPDPAQPKRGLFSSDQRYQIAGGNDRLPTAIAARLGDRIRPNHRLVALRRRGAGYEASFARGGATIVIPADIVILALPATMLRQVQLDIGAPPLTQRAIRELGYGTNAKIFAGLTARPWRAAGRSGECLNDLGIQTVWEDHARDGTGPGGMTIFAGGRTGVDFARGPAADRARAATLAIDAALPGAAAAFSGRAGRMNWPGNHYVGGSYSCFAPGQWTGFGGAFAPVGQVFFAGEHTSETHSGYMDGAAESGRIAAEAVARVLA